VGLGWTLAGLVASWWVLANLENPPKKFKNLPKKLFKYYGLMNPIFEMYPKKLKILQKNFQTFSKKIYKSYIKTFYKNLGLMPQFSKCAPII
jgi:hypothetical protein